MFTNSHSAITAIRLDASYFDASPETRQQLLRFSIDSQNSALLPVDQIIEVLRVFAPAILPVPETPDCVLGICNWRSEMLWLIDLSHLVGYSPLSLPPESMPLFAIIVQNQDQWLGLCVRQVGDIEWHDLQKLQPATPGLFPPKLQPFVLGALPEGSGAVLSVTAITQCPLWQNQTKTGS